MSMPTSTMSAAMRIMMIARSAPTTLLSSSSSSSSSSSLFSASRLGAASAAVASRSATITSVAATLAPSLCSTLRTFATVSSASPYHRTATITTLSSSVHSLATRTVRFSTSAEAASSESAATSSSSSTRLIALNELSDNEGATQQRTRWGRGTGSGRGKRAGRGQKGSFARNSRGIHPWFIGGQTPLYKLLPKRGFQNPNARPLEAVNLDVVARFVQNQRIDASQTITMKTLLDAGVLGKKVLYGVKLLSGINPKLSLPKLDFEVTDCSKSAKALVEASGGSVKLVYHNRLSLRAHLKPERFAAPRTAVIPPPRLQRKYREQQCGQMTTKPKAGEWA